MSEMVARCRSCGFEDAAEFAHCPTQEELEATGDYEGPIKSGAYFEVRTLIHELKKLRQVAGLTLKAVSKCM